jgi:hypothetical protein
MAAPARRGGPASGPLANDSSLPGAPSPTTYRPPDDVDRGQLLAGWLVQRLALAAELEAAGMTDERVAEVLRQLAAEDEAAEAEPYPESF